MRLVEIEEEKQRLTEYLDVIQMLSEQEDHIIVTTAVRRVLEQVKTVEDTDLLLTAAYAVEAVMSKLIQEAAEGGKPKRAKVSSERGGTVVVPFRKS